MIIPTLAIIDIAEAAIRVRAKRKYEEGEVEAKPSELKNFTILIPTHNEVKGEMEFLKNFEEYKDRVLIVDDCSGDSTVDKVRSAGYSVTVNKRNGKKVGAIAVGLEGIDTEYTILVDSDTKLAEGTLEALMQFVVDKKIDGCAVRIMPNVSDSVLEKLQNLEYAKAMTIGRGSMDGEKALVPCISGAFGVFKTSLLREVTKEQIKNGITWEGEDFERTLRCIVKGGRMSYNDRIVAATDIPTNLKDLTSQRIKWQHGYLRCHVQFWKLTFRGDKLGVTFAFNEIVNVLMFPLKLFALWFLVSNVELLASFYAVYWLLELCLARVSLRRDDWKKLWGYTVLMPMYGIYNFVVPTTLGYAMFFVAKVTRIPDEKKFKLRKCDRCGKATAVPYPLWYKDVVCKNKECYAVIEVKP